MIEHCISSFLESRKERAYRIYVTDALKIITENTARFNGGSYLERRFAEVYETKKKEEKELTAEEIIADVDELLATIRGENGKVGEEDVAI